ncbi:THAP domain-containing protein 5-like [Saccostrea cucullata]|uniref:THAP domain-containing protein 5-like n=1 Tax=Saccostrea cuccullata TaxID=36930 RepID=UPI002ECFF348
MECNEADENKPPKRKSEKHGDEPSHYWCSVPGCTSDGRKKANLIKYPWMRGVQFYPYPGAKRKAKLRKRWLQQVFRDERYVPKRYHSVCSQHFIVPVPTLFPRNKVAKQSRTTTSIEKRQPTNSSSDSATVAETSVHSNKCAPMECLLMEDITVSCEGNAGVHIPLPVAHECVIDQISNETCIKEPCSKTEDISHGKYKHDHIYSKQSVEPRCSEDFVDFAVQTDLTMKDIRHMETMTKETDHIHREHFVNELNSPTQQSEDI